MEQVFTELGLQQMESMNEGTGAVPSQTDSQAVANEPTSSDAELQVCAIV